MDKVIVGVFQTQESAIEAIRGLIKCGYNDEDISVLAKQKEKLKRIADQTDTNVDKASKDGTLGGFATGGVVGGIGALLVGLGIVAIPGIGPLIAAGPIAVALAGIAAGGSVGGVVGALADLGINRSEAKEYETYLEQGNILVLVDDKYGEGKVVCDTFAKCKSLTKDRYAVYRNNI